MLVKASGLIASSLFLALCTVAGIAWASNPDEEIVFLVRPDVLELPSSVTSVSVGDLLKSAPSLGSALHRFGITAITRPFPTFVRSDTLRTSSEGFAVKMLDRSHLFTARVLPGIDRDVVVKELLRLPEVLVAERVHRVFPRGVVPNDPEFARQWNFLNIGQYQGTVGADIDATHAWKYTKGTASDRIAVIDGKVETTNPDLQGRVVGSTGTDMHATLVAGLAGASGNNGIGIAGVNWNCIIDSHDRGTSSLDASNAIENATNDGDKIQNDSWGDSTYSFLEDEAFAYAYKNNVLSCVAMPTVGAPGGYPGPLARGMLNVAATTNLDNATTYTASGTFVDVAAPGGNNDGTTGRNLYSTLPGNAFGYTFGTSMAAPQAAGAASLIRRYAADSLGITLYNDDLQQIIRNSTEPVGGHGPDNTTGTGRINVRRAIEWLRQPNVIYQLTATGGTDVGTSGFYSKTFWDNSCIGNGTYQVRRHEVTKTVTHPRSFTPVPYVWGRGAATVGDSDESPNFGEGWCERVGPGGPSSCTLHTYVFEIFNVLGQFIGWCPSDPAHVSFAYTVMDVLPPVSSAPSVTQSYFVPQTGTTSSPTEGTPALVSFRTCPNLDGTQVLANNARVQLVVKNASGVPIAGIAASDIFLVFNGGTAAQGFTGTIADSIIANSKYNPTALCPDVRTIEADAPTDVNGMTYITFQGSTPGNPGVATRDPSRKWGHYDTEIPVYVLGTQLQGRLTTGSANGTYKLQIKNLDILDGLGTGLNVGEAVTSADYNDVTAHNNQADSVDSNNWWRDFDNSGGINSIDVNFVGAHVNHGCNSPNNP